MKRFSNKETAQNMLRGFFKVVPIGMLMLFLWGLLALLGLEVALDLVTAKILVFGLPVLFLMYWFLFKYYDKNNQ
jgi:sterol desaturase/sphingolipid hydroxylase (fatty acid hydroxylase superfamily)